MHISTHTVWYIAVSLESPSWLFLKPSTRNRIPDAAVGSADLSKTKFLIRICVVSEGHRSTGAAWMGINELRHRALRYRSGNKLGKFTLNASYQCTDSHPCKTTTLLTGMIRTSVHTAYGRINCDPGVFEPSRALLIVLRPITSSLSGSRPAYRHGLDGSVLMVVELHRYHRGGKASGRSPTLQAQATVHDRCKFREAGKTYY